MKVIIAGSREVSQKQFNVAMYLLNVHDWAHQITEIVNGDCAKGADRWAKEWAGRLLIPVKSFPADWDSYKRAAGPIRNRQMAKYGDGLIAIWDGTSPGTKNMIDEMENLGKPVRVVRTDTPEFGGI